MKKYRIFRNYVKSQYSGISLQNNTLQLFEKHLKAHSDKRRWSVFQHFFIEGKSFRKVASMLDTNKSTITKICDKIILDFALEFPM